jgi:Holliday junction resolvase-like predicted endonuclease
MSTATDGRRREHKVRDAMVKQGWELIARSAGSKGPADLVMASETRGVALIQVGTGSKQLGPAARARLLRAAWLCSAEPVIAQVIPRRGIRYWHLGQGPASTWTEWTP